MKGNCRVYSLVDSTKNIFGDVVVRTESRDFNLLACRLHICLFKLNDVFDRHVMHWSRRGFEPTYALNALLFKRRYALRNIWSSSEVMLTFRTTTLSGKGACLGEVLHRLVHSESILRASSAFLTSCMVPHALPSMIAAGQGSKPPCSADFVD